MNRIWFAILVVLVSCCLQTEGCSLVARRVAIASMALQLTNLCQRQAQLGHLEDALKQCSAAVRLSPTYSPAWFYRALIYTALGKPDLAMGDLDTTIRLNPSFALAYAQRCIVRLNFGGPARPDEIADCNTAIEMAPGNPLAISAQYSLDIRQQNYRAAEQLGSRLIESSPYNVSGYLYQADGYLRMHDFDNAQATLQLAEAQLRTVHGAGQLALAEMQAGNWRTALEDADQAVRYRPHDAESYNNRCYIRIRMNEVASAQHDCAIALSLSSNDPHIRDTRADILYRLRDYKGVLADEDSMIARYPYVGYGYGNRCAAQTALGSLAKALNDCNAAIVLNPEEGQWYVNRGNVERAQGKTKQALLDYEHSWAMDPAAFEALREEASTYLRIGDVKDALSAASAYVNDNPYDPVGHDVLGRALAASEDKASAGDQFALAEVGYRVRHDNISIAAIKSQLALLDSVKN